MTEERMTGHEIDALEALAKMATPGPWMRDRDAGNIVMKPDRPGDDWDGALVATTRDVVDEDLSGWHDAEFIAAASPDVILDLISQLRYMVLNAEGLSRNAAELKRERDDARASLDARWEHSDHTAAKYYRRMRVGEQLRERAEAERDRANQACRTLGEIVERHVTDTLRWAGMEDQIGMDDPDQQLAWERCAEMPGKIAALTAELDEAYHAAARHKSDTALFEAECDRLKAEIKVAVDRLNPGTGEGAAIDEARSLLSAALNEGNTDDQE